MTCLALRLLTSGLSERLERGGQGGWPRELHQETCHGGFMGLASESQLTSGLWRFLQSDLQRSGGLWRLSQSFELIGGWAYF